ncbi:hypothetical protein GOODEAATRI_031549, partial [Goodea atripinnis]
GGHPGSQLPGMGGQPVYNPPVPYSSMIPGGMYPKRTIIIRGMIPHGANRMGFNLVVSRSRDIAFHMNPRVKEGAVVRNTRTDGKWGKEDRELSMNPFMEGQYFDVSNAAIHPVLLLPSDASDEFSVRLSDVDSLWEAEVQGVCERAALV